MALLTVLLLTASAGVAPIDSLLPLPPWRPHDTKADLFLIPHALTLDPLGRLWVLDRGRGRLMVLDSRGEGASFGVEGEDRSSAPTVADVAASGTYLFVLEPPVPSIALLDLDGFFRGRVDLAGEIEEAGWQGFLPARILVDRSGDLWLIEGSSGRLLRLDRRGRFLDAPLDALAGGIRPERIADAALGPDDGLLLLDPAASRIVLLNRDGVLLPPRTWKVLWPSRSRWRPIAPATAICSRGRGGSGSSRRRA